MFANIFIKCSLTISAPPAKSDSNKSAIHQVDGISGATVTADGVTDFLLEDLLRYEKTLDKIRDYGTI